MAGENGGSATGPHYAASKGGLRALCRWSAKHGAPDVRVNLVAPGLLDTDMTRGEGYPTDVSLLRRQGTAEEVAEVAVFLASPASSYMTGSIVPVDGGVHTQ